MCVCQFFFVTNYGICIRPVFVFFFFVCCVYSRGIPLLAPAMNIDRMAVHSIWFFNTSQACFCFSGSIRQLTVDVCHVSHMPRAARQTLCLPVFPRASCADRTEMLW